jgi:hypothetical protein
VRYNGEEKGASQKHRPFPVRPASSRSRLLPHAGKFRRRVSGERPADPHADRGGPTTGQPTPQNRPADPQKPAGNCAPLSWRCSSFLRAPPRSPAAPHVGWRWRRGGMPPVKLERSSHSTVTCSIARAHQPTMHASRPYSDTSAPSSGVPATELVCWNHVTQREPCTCGGSCAHLCGK